MRMQVPTTEHSWAMRGGSHRNARVQWRQPLQAQSRLLSTALCHQQQIATQPPPHLCVVLAVLGRHLAVGAKRVLQVSLQLVNQLLQKANRGWMP